MKTGALPAFLDHEDEEGGGESLKELGFLMTLWCHPRSPGLLASGLHLHVSKINDYLFKDAITHAGNFLSHHPLVFLNYLVNFLLPVSYTVT